MVPQRSVTPVLVTLQKGHIFHLGIIIYVVLGVIGNELVKLFKFRMLKSYKGIYFVLEDLLQLIC